MVYQFLINQTDCNETDAMKLISISIRNVVNQSFSHGARLSGVLLLSVEISDKPKEEGKRARLDFWLFSALSFRAILLFG